MVGRKPSNLARREVRQEIGIGKARNLVRVERGDLRRRESAHLTASQGSNLTRRQPGELNCCQRRYLIGLESHDIDAKRCNLVGRKTPQLRCREPTQLVGREVRYIGSQSAELYGRKPRNLVGPQNVEQPGTSNPVHLVGCEDSKLGRRKAHDVGSNGR